MLCGTSHEANSNNASLDSNNMMTALESAANYNTLIEQFERNSAFEKAIPEGDEGPARVMKKLSNMPIGTYLVHCWQTGQYCLSVLSRGGYPLVHSLKVDGGGIRATKNGKEYTFDTVPEAICTLAGEHLGFPRRRLAKMIRQGVLELKAIPLAVKTRMELLPTSEDSEGTSSTYTLFPDRNSEGKLQLAWHSQGAFHTNTIRWSPMNGYTADDAEGEIHSKRLKTVVSRVAPNCEPLSASEDQWLQHIASGGESIETSSQYPLQ